MELDEIEKSVKHSTLKDNKDKLSPIIVSLPITILRYDPEKEDEHGV